MEDQCTPDDTRARSEGAEENALSRLSLVRVTEGGRALLLRDDLGAEFTLPISPLLRTSVHGGTPRRSETKMTSSLRPRDIQNRIRSGETPESVAEVAGTSVEAIMPYVGPVLAEREHVAQTALRASLRRGPGEVANPPINRVLGDAVEGHIRTNGGDPETIEWDAYRRETGRWVLTATFDVSGRSGTARFTYDAPGNYALTDNDDARWLIGDAAEAETAADAGPTDDLQQARARRAAAVSELPLGGSLGDDALGLVDEDGPAEDQLSFDEPLRPTTPPPSSPPPAAPPTAETAATEEEPAENARHRRNAAKKRGRASVPSWDEIMFGPTGD